MKERLDQFTAVASLHLKAALADAEIALEHAEVVMSSEHAEELKRVVATQRLVFREHDTIRVQEELVQLEVWEQHEQLQV